MVLYGLSVYIYLAFCDPWELQNTLLKFIIIIDLVCRIYSDCHRLKWYIKLPLSNIIWYTSFSTKTQFERITIILGFLDCFIMLKYFSSFFSVDKLYELSSRALSPFLITHLVWLVQASKWNRRWILRI